ncbi:PREDICTED: kinesin-like protein KIF20A [Habropoda laboriosa]|uniref:kinesin-like protein KIF20A n=1 Tax=Habropoda laboriosa TaxID=597456 RepID=UPI00083D026E|nr:PREDICTED: kinesin-like protein KIF20A [Habropoda laboriosa]
MLSTSFSSPNSPKSDESAISRHTSSHYTPMANVYLRIRPNTVEPKEQIYTVTNATTLLVKKNENPDKRFTFTKIFHSDSSQEELFHHAVRQQVINFLYGESSTVLTYGPSNSGKTYTMYGTPDSPGIVPRALDLLFSVINCTLVPWYKLTDDNRIVALGEHKRTAEIRNKEAEFSCLSSVWISIAEVYNDNVYDLLILDDAQRRPLKMTTHKDGSTRVNSLRSVHVTAALEVFQLLVSARSRMSVASTAANASSSRSHTFLTAKLLRYEKESVPDEVQLSTLTFCDVAASRRLKRDEEPGVRLMESRSINKSLFVLGRCLKAVNDSHSSTGDDVIGPFRESKLTRILQKPLTGQQKVSFVVTIDTTAESFPETLSVLNVSAVARRLGRNVTSLLTSTASGPENCATVDFEEPGRPVLRESIESTVEFEAARGKIAKETQTEGTFVDYDELREMNVQLMKDLETSECRRLYGELEIRREMADQYSIAIEGLENSWKKRVQDVEDEGRDLLKWSVKQVETFYKERIDSIVCNKKRKRNENSDGIRSIYEELETENSMITSKVVVLRETVENLRTENKLLCTEKNECNFELTLVKEKLRDFHDSLRICFPELSSRKQDDTSNSGRLIRELKRVFDEKTRNVEVLERELCQARSNCVKTALKSMEMEKEFGDTKSRLKDFEDEAAENKNFVCTLQDQVKLLKEELAKIAKCKVDYARPKYSLCNDDFFYDDCIDDAELVTQAHVDIKAEHCFNYDSKKVSLNSTDAGIDCCTFRSSDSGNMKEDSGIDFSSRSQKSISLNDCNSDACKIEDKDKGKTRTLTETNQPVNRKVENVKRLEDSLEKCVHIEDQLSLFDLRYKKMKRSFAKCKAEHVSQIDTLEKELLMKAWEVNEADKRGSMEGDLFSKELEIVFEKSEEEKKNYQQRLQEHLEAQSKLEMKLQRLSREIRNRDDELVSLRVDIRNDSENVEFFGEEIVRSNETVNEKLAYSEDEETCNEEIQDPQLQLTSSLNQVHEQTEEKGEEFCKLKLQLFENELETDLIRKHRNDLIKKYECMIEKNSVMCQTKSDAFDCFDICESIGSKNAPRQERMSGWMKVRKSNAKMDLLYQVNGPRLK